MHGFRRRGVELKAGRYFSTTFVRPSGHNRWSTIRHDKGKNDAVKNRQRGELAHELTAAVRLNGAEALSNPRLSNAITAAKKAGFPKASIEAAIARGQGVSASGAPLEPLLVEAILPGGVAAVVECETDNKARTLQEVRSVIREREGSIAPTAYLFEKRGRVVLTRGTGGVEDRERSVEDVSTSGEKRVEDVSTSGEKRVEDVFDDAVDVGAEDIGVEGGKIVVWTSPSTVQAVATGLAERTGLGVEGSGIVWSAREETKVGVSEAEAGRVQEIVQAVREDPAVVGVYLNGREGVPEWT